MKNFFSICIIFIASLLNAQATKHVIHAGGTSFSPNTITGVLVGDTMRWEWQNNSHTTTSVSVPSGASTWDSPLNSSNTTFEYRVTEVGTYTYKCIPHESFGMTGSFTVVAPPNPCDTLNCNDNDACTVDDCDSTTGCFYSAVDCDDFNACTTDSCANGNCGNATIPGCVQICDTLTCSDGDLCTIDSCTNDNCFFPAISCDDGAACTTDSCNNGNCISTPMVCDDGDPCTTDACDNGNCVFTPMTCNDGSSCTTDSCNNGNCIFTPMVCNDGDSCTTDACDNGTCEFTPIVGCPVGIREFSSMPLRVYPNPVQDLLTVDGMNSMLTRIFITDIAGKQVYDSGVINALQYTIQTNGFPEGVYLLHVYSNAGQGVRKVQIE